MYRNEPSNPLLPGKEAVRIPTFHIDSPGFVASGDLWMVYDLFSGIIWICHFANDENESTEDR